jgi:hypothetical protein
MRKQKKTQSRGPWENGPGPAAPGYFGYFFVILYAFNF